VYQPNWSVLEDADRNDGSVEDRAVAADPVVDCDDVDSLHSMNPFV
jgi:hypothetical protein